MNKRGKAFMYVGQASTKIFQFKIQGKLVQRVCQQTSFKTIPVPSFYAPIHQNKNFHT